MCLFPRLLQNPKYKKNKKNGGVIPEMKDKRVALVPVGCGECIECKKKKKREWQIRLAEEIKVNKGIFVTLTFDREHYKKYYDKLNKFYQGYDLDNEICTMAVRHFLERVRKKTKKSLRHWLITELGHSGCESVHLHGIIFTDNINIIKEKWQNGYVWCGYQKNEMNINYVNERTINYITKYILKVDLVHKGFKSKILCSPGIGSNYINTYNFLLNKKKKETNENYIFKDGTKSSLPIYYRNKRYSEEEREELWIEKLDKNIRWVLGRKIDVSKDDKEYLALLKEAQQLNDFLGYGNGEISWEEKEYIKNKRNLKIKQKVYGYEF